MKVRRYDWSDKEHFEKLVTESNSMSDVMRKIGLTPSSNAVTFRKYVAKYDIDISHFDPNIDKPKRRNGSTKIPTNEILVEHSTYHRWHLKNRLIKEHLLDNKCSECGIDPCWNGKELKLHLDHVNGVCDDNRLKNLRLLCPNCHSQTSTYAGKNKSQH